MRSILIFIVILALVAIACGSAGDEPPTLAPTVAPAAPSPTPEAPPPTEAPGSTPDASIPDGDQAIVTNIVDGDTIDVELDGEEFRVRYIGIDTPERGEEYFEQATDGNARLVAGQTVILVKDVSETDRFGRLLRYIYLLDGTFVNAELVRQGLAEAVSYPPDDAHYQEFLVLQGEAQASDRGKWGSFVFPDVPADAPSPADGDSHIIITAVDKSAEYVDLGNTGDQAINLSGWVLLSENGNQSCDLAGLIEPGAVLRVWARTADADQGGFNCGFGRAIWNNSDPDPAALYDPAGALVDRHP